MIKRIIDISEKAYIHMKHRQLLIDKEGETIGQIPIEDLGVLILQHSAIVVTQAVIIACQENNVVLVFCDSRHLPYSVVLPISEGHTLHTKVLRQQLAITLPTKKRLWQQIVKYKIKEQASTLALANKDNKGLLRLAEKVKTGDSENYEAQAAKVYWRLLFGDEFRRDVNAEGLNSILNYGYAIMRAMVARALVGSGLHPAIGLHHRNQYNGLCLADDIMEPFRPWVDLAVYKLFVDNKQLEINTEIKQALLGMLSEKVIWKGESLPLMVACHSLTADLKRAYQNSKEKLCFPQLENRIAA
ncbi:MAG: type II CRISPR-associated endonuclease Cas1 [Gammaproteobacteria bacterium]